MFLCQFIENNLAKVAGAASRSASFSNNGAMRQGVFSHGISGFAATGDHIPCSRLATI
jgi:hypothetical protein